VSPCHPIQNQYDALGTLKRVTLPDGTVIDYITDGQNRRIGKKVDGYLTQGFLYGDNFRPVAELDAGNQVISRFVYAGGGNTPTYMIKNGTVYRIMADQVGSPRLIIDTTTGNVAQKLNYDPFGNVTLDTNPGFQPFGFAGGLYDTYTHLTHFGARDYNARTGRWLQKDPILFAGGDTELYGYCVNDPVNFFDPFGLCPETIQNRKGFAGRTIDGLYTDIYSFVNPDLPDDRVNVFMAVVGMVVDSIDPEVGFTNTIIPRKMLGLDGGKSVHIIEKLGEETVSVTHQVERAGEIIHQHQTHIGKYGGQRQFPNQWIEHGDVP
jgi:RHS repeat-associated protein